MDAPSLALDFTEAVQARSMQRMARRHTKKSGASNAEGAGSGGAGGVFSCIVADPPWAIKFGSDTRRHERTGGGDKGTWRSEAAMEYPTMTVNELCTLKVPAARNAHCYIWTINAYVEQTYAVARAWGFRPVVLLTWGKTPRGLGFGGAFVQTTEHILFCRRGRDILKRRADSTWWNWPRPEKDTGPKHSRKPEAFQNLVESISPGPYLEMFARRQRPGWSVWGNQVACDSELVRLGGGGGVLVGDYHRETNSRTVSPSDSSSPTGAGEARRS